MFKRQIAKGIKLLNKKVPGWRRKVKLRKLDLGDCGLCIIGQVLGSENDRYYGRYVAHAYDLGLDSVTATIEHGFETMEHYDILTVEWKDALRRKKK